MRRMILCALACVLLVLCSVILYEAGLDFLAGVFFCSAIIPSCYFEQARRERKAE